MEFYSCFDVKEILRVGGDCEWMRFYNGFYCCRNDLLEGIPSQSIVVTWEPIHVFL